MTRLGFIRHAATFAVVAAGALTLAAMTPAQASVISDTPTLPLPGMPYATSNGDACFPLAGICVTGGSLTLTAPVSSIFNAEGQYITSGALYSGTLTTLSHTPIGPV